MKSSTTSSNGKDGRASTTRGSATRKSSNAQEAIEEYENRNDSTRRLDTVAPEPKPAKSPIAMILDHEYSDDGKVKYLCQAVDGRQKWKYGPEEYNFYWVKLTKDYWQSQVDSQFDHPEDEMDDGYGGEARGMHEPDFRE